MSINPSETQEARQGAPEARYAPWRDLLSTGVHALQPSRNELEAETTTQRGFMPATIPGLLQTPEYARHVFEQLAVSSDGIPPTVKEAVRLRMRRQEALRVPGKSFHIVLTEAPLHYGLVPPDVMREQLTRLIDDSTLPALQLGLIPFRAMPTGRIPLHGFWIMDTRVVTVETFAAALKLTDPSEIRVYSRVFDQMAAAAVYGDEARQLVNSVALTISP